MRKIRLLAAGLGLATAVAAATPALAFGGGAQPSTALRFRTMAPVTGPYVGPANPVRGLAGGGLPWMITSGSATLNPTGHLQVQVRGLVLADSAPVPAALRGTNPVPDFRVVVSCRTVNADGTAGVVNVTTSEFPASTAGDAKLTARVMLPEPCVAPVVFVTSPAAAWFAVSGG